MLTFFTVYGFIMMVVGGVSMWAINKLMDCSYGIIDGLIDKLYLLFC